MYGCKIDNLSILRDNNINIPNFEVIRFEDAIDNIEELMKLIEANNDTSIRQLSIILKKYIEESIARHFNINLCSTQYAVRSSSNIEDGITDSFAGQFDTYLNVEEKELHNKIVDCFKSMYNENVLEYIKQKDIDIKELRMNVMIQEMVQSQYSGILFTSNPQGLLNESVIVVGEGLGEDIVTDRVNTTSYYYNITDNLYYFDGERDYLSKKIIENLIAISKEVIDILGKHLDIEFAIVNKEIYILQARTITTVNDKKPLILDNSNIVESYPGISSPLTISFVNEVYSGVFEGVSRRILKDETELKKHGKVFKNMVGASNGRLYYKISNWYTLIKFLPFNKKIIPVWQEMLGVKNKAYDNEKVNLSIKTRVMTYINSFYEILRTPHNMNELNKKFIKINDEFYKKFSSDLDKKQVIELYKHIEKELLSCWDITLLNDTYTFIFTGLLKGRLKKKYSNYEELTNRYISGISNIESLKPIKELITLAHNKDNMSQEDYKINFNNYIEKYGDRSLEELKLESITFRTNHKLLEEKISEYLSDRDKLEKMYNDINHSEIIKSNNEDLLTRYLINKCMLGIKNREISRLNRCRIYGMVREMFLLIGNIYQKENVIEDKRDIFYLDFNELQSLTDTYKDMKSVVKKRKEDYKIYKLIPSYSRLIFMEKEFNKCHTNINTNRLYLDKNELRGIPCSNGIARGVALIINSIDEAKDVRDKILITKMTDPGWVFLLATAKGVIAEKGSLLSHTAIISRELRIPSIVGVNKLLDTVQNGDEIEMDGTTGIITILKKDGQQR